MRNDDLALVPNEEEIPTHEARRGLTAPFSLVELSPQLVLNGDVLGSAIMTEGDLAYGGRMRELCPYCGDVPLQLALRSKHVIRTHLYCEKCTRCFDAVYPDGSAAFTARDQTL
jgi:hypothetical protein